MYNRAQEANYRRTRDFILLLLISTLLSRIALGQCEDPPDESQRIKEIEERAAELCKKRDELVRERRPIAIRRDELFAEIQQARGRLRSTQPAAAATEQQIAQLQYQLNRFKGNIAKDLKSQQTRLKSTLSSLNRRITADQKLVEQGVPELYALNVQLAPFEQRMLVLSEEFGVCRRQWVQIRRPQQKYAAADFEGLRNVLDDWLIFDPLWPEAFAWAALCAYELEDIGGAVAYLQKAQTLHADLATSRRSSPQLAALEALIRTKQPGERHKVESSLLLANRLRDRDSDWETCFLMGRCYLELPDEAIRCKAHLGQAIKINPNCECAFLWLARLQTTCRVESVRDVQAGTAQLEQIWEKSEKRSWRLARFLAEAYTAAQRMTDAERMWDTAMELSPPDQKSRIARERGSMAR